MILEKNKFIFRTIFMVFEEEKAKEIISSGKYDSIVLISRKDMNLGISRREKKTSVIDLNVEEEAIFDKFSDTTKNEIRKSENNQNLSFKNLDENRKEIFKLYKDFEYGQGRVPFAESDMKDCLIFSSYLNGKPISAMYVDVGGKDLRIRYIFSDRLNKDKEFSKIVSNSTRKLVWEICLWGKKNNFNTLDMATVNFDDPKVLGITKFKMSFGGKVLPEYFYIYRSKIFILFEKMAILKNIIKKIIKI